MSSAVSAFACVIPAGGTTTVALNVAQNQPVVAVHWRVPPGNRGHLSWFIAQSGAQVLPNSYDTAMVADGESDTWQLRDFPQSGAWSLVGTNTGTSSHTVYLEFTFDTPSSQTTTQIDFLAGFPQSDVDVAGMWLG